MPDHPPVVAGIPVAVPSPTSLPDTLPCWPCPHSSTCCRFGTSVTPAEHAAMVQAHGPEVVRAVPGDLRTAVGPRGCVFLGENGCLIHDETYYPATCRAFPWADRDGGPYQGDLSICPELVGDPQED